MRDVLAEELARQNAPSKRCTGTVNGKPCPQIVKLNTLCPACSTKAVSE